MIPHRSPPQYVILWTFCVPGMFGSFIQHTCSFVSKFVKNIPRNPLRMSLQKAERFVWTLFACLKRPIHTKAHFEETFRTDECSVSSLSGELLTWFKFHGINIELGGLHAVLTFKHDILTMYRRSTPTPALRRAVCLLSEDELVMTRNQGWCWYCILFSYMSRGRIT